MLGVVALNQQGVSSGLADGQPRPQHWPFFMVGFFMSAAITRMLDDFGGLWQSVPVFCGFFLSS